MINASHSTFTYTAHIRSYITTILLQVLYNFHLVMAASPSPLSSPLLSPTIPTLPCDTEIAFLVRNKRKSKKADLIEQYIMALLHELYNERPEKDKALKFDLTACMNSASNLDIRKNWRSLLLRKRPEEHKHEDWTVRRMDNRLKALFSSKKTGEKRSAEASEAKKARDRRLNRLADKKFRCRAALDVLVKKGSIPKDKVGDILHIDEPSEEEAAAENNGKVLKTAQAIFRSEELLQYTALKWVMGNLGSDLLHEKVPMRRDTHFFHLSIKVTIINTSSFVL